MEENNKPEEQDVNETNEETKAQQEENEVNEQAEADTDDAAEDIPEEEKLKAEVSEWQNKHLRLYAEFDNFKRRTSKERLDLLQAAGKDVILSLLPVLDDFERAEKSLETASDVEAVKEGIKLIHQKLRGILSQQGLKDMNARGTDFDPELHEGITNIPAPTADLKGKVIDELEKGYYLKDKVIRFAKVIVGS